LYRKGCYIGIGGIVGTSGTGFLSLWNAARYTKEATILMQVISACHS